MRNRAKCRLCNEMIESFHQFDLIACKCGEISITGGNTSFGTSAKDYANFIRIDDEDNEIEVKFVDKKEDGSSGFETNKEPPPISHDCDNEKHEDGKAISKEEKIRMLDQMVKNIEALPERAMSLPVNHYDHYSALALIHSILASKSE